jgi:hypothetical protein
MVLAELLRLLLQLLLGMALLPLPLLSEVATPLLVVPAGPPSGDGATTDRKALSAHVGPGVVKVMEVEKCSRDYIFLEWTGLDVYAGIQLRNPNLTFLDLTGLDVHARTQL